MTYKKAYSIINGLRLIQARHYNYEEFLLVIKRRIRLYTGKTEVMFMDEIGVAETLEEIGIAERETIKPCLENI